MTGDGRLDLASSDGKALTIWSQGADGTFASAAVAEKPEGDCMGLAAMDAGVKGRPESGLGPAGRAPVLLVRTRTRPGSSPEAAGGRGRRR